MLACNKKAIWAQIEEAGNTRLSLGHPTGPEIFILEILSNLNILRDALSFCTQKYEVVSLTLPSGEQL